MSTMRLKIAPEVKQMILVEREGGVKGYGRLWNRRGDTDDWISASDVFPLVYGKGGLTTADKKREGDLKTPEGLWRLRKVLYRRKPVAPHFPAVAIGPDDKWIDDPAHPDYNRWVRTETTAASFEKLWRQDSLYDLVFELGYNDSPPVPGHGSAIFMHLWKSPEEGTAGCLACDRKSLEMLLLRLDSSKAPSVLIP